MYQHKLGLKKNVLLSVLVAHFWAVKVIAKFGVSHSSIFRVAFCHYIAPCSCFASGNCFCCHDPFIVRSAQTCPTLTGFTQLVNPSRCSPPTLTTVCLCSFDSQSMCVCRGCSPLTRSNIGFITFHLVVECGVRSVNRIPILQTCKGIVVQKQRLASFQHLRSSSLQAPSLY